MIRLPLAALLSACSMLVGDTLAPAQIAIAQTVTPPAFSFAGPASDDYSKGTRALDQQRWQDAITDFDRVISAHGQRADAALYWKAYALKKLSRSNLVNATCSQLHSTYPRSTWNRDCSALSATDLDPGIYAGGPHAEQDGSLHGSPQANDDGIYRGAQPHQPPVDPNRVYAMQDQLHGTLSPFLNTPSDAGSDADLKMLALNSLLQREPARALPVIRNILTGANSSPQLKQRAITALAMNQSTEAQALLRDVATGRIAPQEQRQAIQMLGVFQGKRADDTLAEIYRTTANHDVKDAAITALFIAGDATRLVDLARNEKDLQLKHNIVTKLALMQDKAATDYMLELLK